MPTEELKKYTVKAGTFEGPLELLLDLIEKRKLFINEISLASVTDEYIEYVKNLKQDGEKMFADMTSFIIIAATLILIKSRSLLPEMPITEDEKGQIGSLEERLMLFKTTKEAGEMIVKLFGKKIIYAPLERKNQEVVFSADKQLTLETLHKCAQDVLSNIPKKEFLPEVEVKKVISIEEMIENLSQRIAQGMTTSFRQFSGSHNGVKTKEEKVFVIVSFLAMLELVRQGIMDVIQRAHFDEIEMKKLEKIEENIENYESGL
jgi:segregation and condensation protein A